MYFFWPLSWYSNYLIPGYTSPPICCFCLSLWEMPPTSTSQPQLTSSLHARGEETPPNHSVSLLPGPNFLSQSRLSTSFLTENQSSRDQKRRKQSRLMWWSSSMGNKWVDVRMRSALCCKSWAMEAKSRAGRYKGGRTEGSHTWILAPSLSSGESSKLCTWVARVLRNKEFLSPTFSFTWRGRNHSPIAKAAFCHHCPWSKDQQLPRLLRRRWRLLSTLSWINWKNKQTTESAFSLGKFSFCINSDVHQNMSAQINRKLLLNSLCFVPQFTISSLWESNFLS